MRLCYALFLLLPLVAASDLFHFELHGTLRSIGAEHIRNVATNRAQFLPQEEQIKAELAKLLSEDLPSFFVQEFQIHGEDSKPTAVFYAYISTSKSRDEMLQLVKVSESLQLFFAMPMDALPSPPPTTSEANSQISCTNGGFPLPNATCSCPPFYKGADCSQTMCLNGGIADGNRCACPPGLYGMYCEPRGCLPQVQDKFDISAQTFILVVNQRSSMAYVLNYMVINIGNTIDALTDIDPLLTDNFVLVNYVDTVDGLRYMNKKYATSKAQFMGYLAGISAVDGADEQPTNDAVFLAQNFYPFMHGFSNVFVFTDAVDTTIAPPTYTISSNTSELNLITQTLAWRNRIVYFIGQPPKVPIDFTMDDYDVFRRVSAATLGDLISFDLMEIKEILNNLIIHYQHNEVVFATYSSPPSELTQTLSIPKNDDGEILVLLTVGPNGTLPSVFTSPVEVFSLGYRFQLLRYNTSAFDFKYLSMTNAFSLRAFAISTKTALVAYAADISVDIGTSYIPAETAPFVTGALIGFTGTPYFALLANNGTTTSTPYSGQQRLSECSYPISFNLLMSEVPVGAQMIQITFGDGNTRVLPGYSGYLDHHFAINFDCLNGGSRTGPSKCECTDQWQGPNCGTPVCAYNGKVNPFPGNGQPLCLCPHGYGGDHCDFLNCTSAPQAPYLFSSNRSLAIVLQSSMSQSQINGKINTGLNSLLGAMQGADAFTEYILTQFNNIIRQGQNYTQILTTPYSSAADLKYGMRSDNIQYMASSTSTQDSFTALFNTMNAIDNDKSSIFLFVDSPPSNTYDENYVIMNAVARQLEISIIITPPYGMKEMCMQDYDAQVYTKIAQQTGGMIYNLCNDYKQTYTTDPIVQFFIAYGDSHHHTENLNEVLDVSGDKTVSLNFVVDDASNEVYVFVNSFSVETFTVTVTDLDTNDSTPLQPVGAMPFIGIYRITPSYGNIKGYTVTTTTGTKITSLRISEKSSNSVYMGFSSDPSIDRQSSTMLYGTPTSPVVHMYGPAGGNARSSVTLTVSDDQGTVLYTKKSSSRTASCQYEFFLADQFVCPTPEKAYILTAVVVAPNTATGTLTRTQRGYCYKKDLTCLNGGEYVNGECECLRNYVGTSCEYPVCKNGGKTSAENNFACTCAAGFTGTLCEYGSCDVWNFLETTDVRERSFKQITFVVNKNLDMLNVYSQLTLILQSFVDQTESKTIPKQYSLITFDENGVYNVVSSAHSARFIQVFKNSINSYTKTTPATTQAVNAIKEAYQINIEPPNIIYLFTGTNTMNPTGGATGIYGYLRQRIGTQLNLIYTPKNVDYPAQPTGALQTYVSLAARQSGGRVLPLTQNSISSLTSVLVSSVLEDALIHDDGAQDCSSGKKFQFHVENNFAKIVIDITGNDVSNAGNVVLSDGTGRNIVITKNNTLFKDKAAIVYSLGPNDVNPNGQMWSAYVTTTSGSCFIQVRASTPIRIVPGFTGTPTQDFVKSAPFTTKGTGFDQTTYMTFRVVDKGFSDVGTSLTTMSIFQTQYYQSWSGLGHLRDQAINPRDPTNCANQFMAGPWPMDIGTNDGFQKFIVTGITAGNSQFQRTFYFNLPNSNTYKQTCVYGNRNTHGECICDFQHTGDFCTDPICLNGGTTSFGVCACSNGYFGEYCQDFIIASANGTSVDFYEEIF